MFPQGSTSQNSQAFAPDKGFHPWRSCRGSSFRLPCDQIFACFPATRTLVLHSAVFARIPVEHTGYYSQTKIEHKRGLRLKVWLSHPCCAAAEQGRRCREFVSTKGEAANLVLPSSKLAPGCSPCLVLPTQSCYSPTRKHSCWGSCHSF